MPRFRTLLLLVTLAVVATTTSTGCQRCGETGNFEDHCKGDTRVFCDGNRVRRQKCGCGKTCSEVGPRPYAYTECVDDSLTSCEDTVCSEAALDLDMSIRSLQRKLNWDGTSFRDITNEVRLARARGLPAETELPVTQIAFDLGYSGPAHFARAFRKIEGCSPGEYRTAVTP